MEKYKFIVPVLLAAVLLASVPARADTVDDRMSEIRWDHINRQYPDPCSGDADTACWGLATYALACLHEGQDTATANSYINYIQDNYNVPTDGSMDFTSYFKLPLLWRTYHDANCSSNLTSSARDDIENMMWRFIESRSKKNDAEDTLRKIHMSENHDMMHKSGYLLACEALLDAGAPYSPTMTLDDGYNLLRHRNEWNECLKEYFRQRAREGLNCEIASPSYAKYTLGCYYNIRDFADDSELADLAENAITLFWADTASDYLDAQGVRGGGETRCYKDNSLLDVRNYGLRQVLYGYDWHDTDGGSGSTPFVLMPATSDYRMAAVVTACATGSKDPFGYASRRFGMGTHTGSGDTLVYTLSYDSGNASNIRRDTFVTDDYVMGTITLNSAKDYTLLIDQNRAMGVFGANDPCDRIVFHGKGTIDDGRTGYAEITGLCGENCMVLARDKDATSSDGTRIFVSYGPFWTNRVENDSGWFFTYSGNTYVGIKIAAGTDPTPYYVAHSVDKGKMLDMEDLWSPVVIQMGQAGDYSSFTDFKNSVKANEFDYSNSKLTYVSEAYEKHEIWRYSDNLPQIDDQPAEMNPSLTYDSPYICGYHGEDTITLSYPGYDDLTLDFTYKDSEQRDDYQTKGLWHMDELVSGKVPDDDQENAGRDKDLTPSGATVTTGGYFDKALNFDGTNDMASYTNFWQSYKAVKVSFWFKADVDDRSNQYLVQTRNTWLVNLYYDDVKFTVWTDGDARTITLTDVVETGTWQHVSASVDEDGVMVLQVDDNSTSSTGLAMIQQTQTLEMGNKLGYERWFDGKIDDVKVLVPLVDWASDTPSALADDGDTLALWHMDSTIAGPKVPDDDSENAGRDNDINLSGATLTGTTGGIISRGLNFDGTNDQAYLANLWASYETVRVEFWFKADVDDRSNQTMVNATSTWQVTLSYDDVTFTVWTDISARTMTLTDVVQTGAWQHVIASIDPKGRMRLEVDGQMSETTGDTMKQQTKSVYLGNKQGQTRWFDGVLDEVKISTPD